jgi:hypothetical protein
MARQPRTPSTALADLMRVGQIGNTQLARNVNTVARELGLRAQARALPRSHSRTPVPHAPHRSRHNHLEHLPRRNRLLRPRRPAPHHPPHLPPPTPPHRRRPRTRDTRPTRRRSQESHDINPFSKTAAAQASLRTSGSGSPLQGVSIGGPRVALVTTAKRPSAAPETGRAHRGARPRFRCGSPGPGAGATARRRSRRRLASWSRLRCSRFFSRSLFGFGAAYRSGSHGGGSSTAAHSWAAARARASSNLVSSGCSRDSSCGPTRRGLGAGLLGVRRRGGLCSGAMSDGPVPDAVLELGGHLGGGGLERPAGLLHRGDVGRLLLPRGRGRRRMR